MSDTQALGPPMPGGPGGDAEPDGKPPGELLGRVVAIGASAGGLEALESFFTGLGACPTAAFVVIQHLSADHKSMMEQLLARHTPMPVVLVEDGMLLAPGRIHLLPPAAVMSVFNGRLRLTPKRSKSLTLPIDLFFSSLAHASGPAAIGVVLSGTGSDGSRGALEINDAGGILIAQDPEQAKFDGMPRSVIGTGVVDFVLSAQAIGPKIKELLQIQPQPAAPPAQRPEGADSGISQILMLVHNAGGVDFRAYKPNSLTRRIERRMRVRNTLSYEQYAAILQHDRDELLMLQREILIPVTSFFRDTDHFEALSKQVVDPLVAEVPEGQELRVWVTACSTGEEAYSIAMLFLESFERARRWPSLKIFATDVDRQNIEIASAGLYRESIAADISAERLERFFVKKGNQYEVHKKLRERIIFARHNVLEDPPFTRISLISCRNMLIYMQPSAQTQVFRRFQYSLFSNGYLFLGSSESLGDVAGDFVTLASRQKIFRLLRRNELPLEFRSRLAEPREGRKARAGRTLTQQPLSQRNEAMVDNANDLLLQAYVPASVLVAPGREIMHMFGDARRYLQFPEGQMSLDIAKLLPETLAPIGAALLHKASRDRATISSNPIPLRIDSSTVVQVRLVARPLPCAAESEPHVLLSFESQASDRIESAQAALDVGQEHHAHIQLLEQELAATRESLQATIEELETSNEELQATNEELMSSNEELQSSNEELQSVNEELYTVNAEHQEKNEILHRLNADLNSMAQAVSIATVFVDPAIRITRFTPEARRFFRVQDGDIGRPLDHLAHNLSFNGLIDEIRSTMSGGLLAEREVRALDGNTYLLRILPYTVREGEPRGAVITVIDITSLHTSRRLQSVLDSLPEHIAEIDADGRICMVNWAWQQFARDNGDGLGEATGVGTNYLEICRRSQDAHAQRAFLGLTRVLHGDDRFFSMQYPCHSPSEQRWFLMYVAPIEQPGGGAIVSHINITSWVQETHGESRQP